MQPHISLKDRLVRLEKLLGIHNITRRLFEADDEEIDNVSTNEEDIDKAVNDPEVKKKVDTISKSLKDAGLVEYVANVNDMMSDDKGRLALELVAGTLPADKLKKLENEFKSIKDKATTESKLNVKLHTGSGKQITSNAGKQLNTVLQEISILDNQIANLKKMQELWKKMKKAGITLTFIIDDVWLRSIPCICF